MFQQKNFIIYNNMANTTQINKPFQIQYSGPLDNRAVVETYNDIFNIQNPSVGLMIYVKDDDR